MTRFNVSRCEIGPIFGIQGKNYKLEYQLVGFLSCLRSGLQGKSAFCVCFMNATETWCLKMNSAQRQPFPKEGHIFFSLESFRPPARPAYWAPHNRFRPPGAAEREEHHSYVFSYKLGSKWAPEAGEAGRGGPPLASSLFIAEEVLIKFIVLKTPTYQLQWRAGQATVNRSHQSTSHFNEMKQINCFSERCPSALLPQVPSFCSEFAFRQLAVTGLQLGIAEGQRGGRGTLIPLIRGEGVAPYFKAI